MTGSFVLPSPPDSGCPAVSFILLFVCSDIVTMISHDRREQFLIEHLVVAHVSNRAYCLFVLCNCTAM